MKHDDLLLYIFLPLALGTIALILLFLHEVMGSYGFDVVSLNYSSVVVILATIGLVVLSLRELRR